MELSEALRKHRSMSQLENMLESGMREEYFRNLSAITGPIRRIESKDNLLAKEAYMMVALNILSYANRRRITGKFPPQLSLDRLTDIDSHESWAGAADYLSMVSEYLFMVRTEKLKRRKSADVAVDFIQRYVRDHLNEELSLAKLAEQVYLNPSYLSRLFRKTMGTTITDYIDNVKIAQAKSLLEQDDIKIRDVAKTLGYDSAASFTRFFRKLTGVTPQEYHELRFYSKLE
jgi:two-component system response regulator YesN